MPKIKSVYFVNDGMTAVRGFPYHLKTATYWYEYTDCEMHRDCPDRCTKLHKMTLLEDEYIQKLSEVGYVKITYMNKKIWFKDEGQDFLMWEVMADGTIINSEPFQFDIWSNWKVTNFEDLKQGGFVDIHLAPGVIDEFPDGKDQTIRYKIEKIQEV